MSVFRISAGDAHITVETWANWASFDDTLPPARALWCDLADAIQAPGPGPSPASGIFELQRLRIQNGHGADGAELLAKDAAAWEEAGAAVIGSFRVVHGDDLPACLLLLGWPSLGMALDAQPRVERDAGSTERRRLAREASGIAVMRGCRRVFRPGLVFVSGSAP